MQSLSRSQQWEMAQRWLNEANADKHNGFDEPRWSFDCGFKLDFDGGLIRVSSRFYGSLDNSYSGSVSFCILDNDIFEREFSSRSIDILKEDVEKYVRSVFYNIEELLKSNLNVFAGG